MIQMIQVAESTQKTNPSNVSVQHDAVLPQEHVQQHQYSQARTKQAHALVNVLPMLTVALGIFRRCSRKTQNM